MQQQNQTHSISEHSHNHLWVRYTVVFCLVAVIVLRIQLALWLVPLTEPTITNINVPVEDAITANVGSTHQMTMVLELGMMTQSDGATP
ncbi:MAG: hypothetical protein AAF639_11960 [Chloroflexota bacterium]